MSKNNPIKQTPANLAEQLEDLKTKYEALEKKYRALLLQNLAHFEEDFRPFQVITLGMN